jgi:hypothetical protein
MRLTCWICRLCWEHGSLLVSWQLRVLTSSKHLLSSNPIEFARKTFGPITTPHLVAHPLLHSRDNSISPIPFISDSTTSQQLFIKWQILWLKLEPVQSARKDSFTLIHKAIIIGIPNYHGKLRKLQSIFPISTVFVSCLDTCIVWCSTWTHLVQSINLKLQGLVCARVLCFLLIFWSSLHCATGTHLFLNSTEEAVCENYRDFEFWLVESHEELLIEKEANIHGTCESTS